MANQSPVLAPIARVVKLGTEHFCEIIRDPIPGGTGLVELANKLINGEKLESDEVMNAKLSVEGLKSKALEHLEAKKEQYRSHPAVAARLAEEKSSDPTLNDNAAFDKVFASMRYAVINLARAINLGLQ